MAVILTKHSHALSTADFTYSKGVFSAEASDFKGLEFILEQRVYDDAIDTGFVLENPITKNRIRYCYWQAHYSPDPDRELLYEEYRPLPQDAKEFPAVANTKVIIFND